jgi:hypothetical protein
MRTVAPFVSKPPDLTLEVHGIRFGPPSTCERISNREGQEKAPSLGRVEGRGRPSYGMLDWIQSCPPDISVGDTSMRECGFRIPYPKAATQRRGLKGNEWTEPTLIVLLPSTARRSEAWRWPRESRDVLAE